MGYVLYGRVDELGLVMFSDKNLLGSGLLRLYRIVYFESDRK